MRSLGYNPTEIELQDVIDQFDADNSGTMDFVEFLQMMVQNMPDDEASHRCADLLQTFGMFDKNGDGYISASELREIMSNLGERFRWSVWLDSDHIDHDDRLWFHRP
jgi:calmodulin